MNATTPAPNAEAEDADQEPGQETDHAAGRERPADAAEHAPKDRAADQREDEQERQQRGQARHVLRGCAPYRRGQRLAFDDAHHAIDGRRDTAVEVAAPELRHDVLVDDAIGDGVGQRALEAVADLDAAPCGPAARRAAARRRRHRLRPSFQASATRSAYCSIASGSVVATISTAIWLPLACSNARSLASSAATWSGVSVPVRSVTGAFSAGTGTSCCAGAGIATNSKPTVATSATVAGRRSCSQVITWIAPPCTGGARLRSKVRARVRWSALAPAPSARRGSCRSPPSAASRSALRSRP